MIHQSKPISFSLLLSAAAILFLLLSVPALGAEESVPPASPHSIDADVSYGFSDKGKLGTYLPVTVSIDGEYAGTEGLAVLSYSIGDGKQYRTEQSFSVSEEGCQITLYLPVFTGTLPVKVMLLTDGTTVFEEDQVITSSDFYEITIAVVTRSPEPYAVWDGMLLNETYAVYGDLVFLTPEEFPTASEKLDTIDVLILDDTLNAAFNQLQLQSIEQWISKASCSRHLILSQPDEALVAQLTDFLQVSGTDPFTLNSLTEKTDPDYIYEELSDISCTAYQISGASVLAEDNGHPLIQQVSFAAGTITVTGYALSQTASAFAAHSAVFRAFWNTILDAADFSQAIQTYHFFDSYEETEAYLLAGQDQLEYVSRAGLYIIILLLYAAVLIPLIFYLTRKKRQHLRLLLAINALIFSALVMFIAIPTRHEKPFLNSICLEEYTGTTRNYFSYNSIQSPYSDSFTLEADDSCQVLQAVWGEASEAILDASEKISFQIQGSAISRTESGVSLTFTNQVPFQPEYFELEQTAEVSEPVITSEITFLNGKLTGTITSQLGYDLYDTILLIHGWLVPIDTLKDGSTIYLTQYDKYPFCCSTFSELFCSLVLEDNAYQQQAIRQEKMADTYLFLLERMTSSSSAQVLLLGRSDQTQDMLIENTADFDYYLSHFTAVHLDAVTTENELHYTPSATLLPECLEGSYDWKTRKMLTDEVSLSYRFYQNMEITSLDLIYNALPKNMAGTFQDPELVYAYNWDTGQYTLLSSPSLSQPELSSYLHENQLILYYTGTSDATVLVPAISITWKEQ